MQEDLKERLLKAIEGPIAQKKYELVSLEWKREPRGWVLRIYIDKPGGVTVEDCAKVSEFVGKILDEIDLIHHPYLLEVSSPGIERPLTKKEHFERFKGERVQISLKEPVGGRKNFKGLLLGLKEDKVLLELETGEWVEIEFSNIKKANLKPEISF